MEDTDNIEEGAFQEEDLDLYGDLGAVPPGLGGGGKATAGGAGAAAGATVLLSPSRPAVGAAQLRADFEEVMRGGRSAMS
jgi:hypothetical protein